MTRALFISDLHLAEDAPATLRAFQAFVAGPARQAAALYVLGDLFEYWAGDDDCDAPVARAVCDCFAGLAKAGVAVHFLAGNRDFLVGAAFAERAGMRLMDDPASVELDGHHFVLSHGDALCTDDHAYQAYRKQVRDPVWLNGFLARPLAERKAFIAQLRQQSMAAKEAKRAEIMDVNIGAVEALLRAHGYATLIHGHTHRPARHLHPLDGHRCERWVLSDWDDSAPYIAWDGRALSAHRLRIQPG